VCDAHRADLSEHPGHVLVSGKQKHPADSGQGIDQRFGLVEVTGDSFGPFDAVASLGAFEHFCSPEDYSAGRQEELYRGLFARIASVLPESGRFFSSWASTVTRTRLSRYSA